MTILRTSIAVALVATFAAGLSSSAFAAPRWQHNGHQGHAQANHRSERHDRHFGHDRRDGRQGGSQAHAQHQHERGVHGM